MHDGIQAIVLAAGTSSRFNTGKSKFREKVCGQELILYPLKLLSSLNIPITVVLGNDNHDLYEIIAQKLGDAPSYVHQSAPRGTADAVISTKDRWYYPHLLIMHGDVSLITAEQLNAFIHHHKTTQADATFMTAHNDDPSLSGYDYIVKNEKQIRIDPNNNQERCCVNAGVYLIKKELLENVCLNIQASPSTYECSLAQYFNHIDFDTFSVSLFDVPFDTIRGVNTFKDLWMVEQIKKAQLIEGLINKGVRFYAPQSVTLDVHVSIEPETSIGFGVHLIGDTTIGRNCTIHEFSRIENSTINNNTTILSHSIIKNSHIESESTLGPFAHIREHSYVGNNAIIGNFVELKKANIGSHTKAKHLSYIGDADVGSHVNIGAGSITCNHNGVSKQKTIIHDNAYVGANTLFIAPVNMGANAFTAAGSTITNDIPADALAIARARQINKENYAQKLKNKEQPVESNTTTFIGATKSGNGSCSTNE